jgi:hypothetical protein
MELLISYRPLLAGSLVISYSEVFFFLILFVCLFADDARDLIAWWTDAWQVHRFPQSSACTYA